VNLADRSSEVQGRRGSLLNYAIITPAHNEEAYFEKTVLSMISQTVLPRKWVVVNDGSTDRTLEIIRQYLPRYSFIELLNIERAAGRDFQNKVRAFNKGLAQLRGVECEYIGNLDADISVGPDYFQCILWEFERDPKLGIAGGMVHSLIEGEFVSQEVSSDSVAGAVQLFRRECFEQIGGYPLMPYGGIDAAAEIKARMKGWNVRTIANNHVKEYRRTGSATARPLASRVIEGRRSHSLGYGFVFFMIRCLYRILEKPKLIGSAAALMGYLGSVIEREPVALPVDVVRFLRIEQREKIKRALGLSFWSGLKKAFIGRHCGTS